MGDSRIRAVAVQDRNPLRDVLAKGVATADHHGHGASMGEPEALTSGSPSKAWGRCSRASKGPGQVAARGCKSIRRGFESPRVHAQRSTRVELRCNRTGGKAQGRRFSAPDLSHDPSESRGWWLGCRSRSLGFISFRTVGVCLPRPGRAAALAQRAGLSDRHALKEVRHTCSPSSRPRVGQCSHRVP